MLFFNTLMLTIATLASAQWTQDLTQPWKNYGYSARETAQNYGYSPRETAQNYGYSPREMTLNQGFQGARQAWSANSGSLLDAAQYSPIMYNTNNRQAMIAGRGVGFGGSRVHLLDELQQFNRLNQGQSPQGLSWINAQRGQQQANWANPRNFATGRLLRETEGLPINAVKHVEDESPKPYSFAYDTTDEFNNKMARQEAQDESGRVTGSYSYLDANGLMRRVDYVADEQGFRADVKTNEPGTASSVTGSALIQSAAPSVAESIAAADATSKLIPSIATDSRSAQLAKLQLEKTPVVIRSMDGTALINPALQHLALKDQKIALAGGIPQSLDGNILSMARAKGFEVNPNFMRFALPSINQSFGPASLVKIADPSVGTQFLKAAAAAAAA